MKTFEIQKILVPVDFSETSLEALNHAVYLAKLNKASVSLIHVMETSQPPVTPENYSVSFSANLSEFERALVEESETILKRLVEKIAMNDKIAIDYYIPTGWVEEEILQKAEEINADIIIMGTHGVKGFREFILGSHTFRVVNEAKCPVLSIQQKTVKTGFKTILVPFRDKPHSREKVDYAIAMAKIYGAEIQILGIDTDNDKAQFTKIENEAEQIKSIVEKQNLTCAIKIISTNYLAEEVLKYGAKVNADLVVIMSDLDRMRISEYFMGPFSQQMVNHSPMPVLSIRPTFNPETVDLHGYGW